MDELRVAGEAALRSNIDLRRENDSLALRNCDLAAAGPHPIVTALLPPQSPDFHCFAAEAASAEPWQIQCAQLKSEKSALASRLHAAEAAVAAAADSAAKKAEESGAELRAAREDAAAAREEIKKLRAEVQELRHQVWPRQLWLHVARHPAHVAGVASAALCCREGARFAGERHRSCALQFTPCRLR